MSIILILTVAALVIWIIPAIYVFQCRSRRILIEAGFLFVVSLGLPAAVIFVQRQLYGLAAGIRFEDALAIAGLQMLLWLGALVLTLHANACRLPARFATPDPRQARPDAPAPQAER